MREVILICPNGHDEKRPVPEERSALVDLDCQECGETLTLDDESVRFLDELDAYIENETRETEEEVEQRDVCPSCGTDLEITLANDDPLEDDAADGGEERAADDETVDIVVRENATHTHTHDTNAQHFLLTHTHGNQQRDAMQTFEQRYGPLDGKHKRALPITDVEVRDSGAGGGAYTVKGHAAVFNQESLNLGWFTEYIAPRAFDSVLERGPDCFLDWDHDLRYVFARTKNGTLDLGLDNVGLAYWARVAPVSYADDMRVLLEGGYIDQASFMFTVADDEWRFEEDENGEERVVRTILEVGELYDVCITAMGAYPQTDSSIDRTYVRSFATNTTNPPVLDAPPVRVSTSDPEPEAERTYDAASLARARKRKARVARARRSR